jgi:P27 family predicted phage terminase small subunit
MKPGPPKTPTNLKLIRGTYRRDRAAANEPEPEVAIPEPPDSLSPEAREEWDRISEELAMLGLLTRIDRVALAIYCEMWADFTEASLKIREHGKVIRTKSGNVVENPYYSIRKRSAEILRGYLTEFGMTPASRCRISVPEPQPQRTEADRTAEQFFQ